MSTQLSTQTISFNNQALITFEQNGTHYTAMRPICENIGLDWASQYSRIRRDEILNSTIVIITTVAEDDKSREMVCLPIDYLNGWLFGIDVNRCKPEIRETLIKYKKECYQALHDYWFKGKAERQSAVKIEKLSKEHQTAIKDLVMGRVKNLPKDKQAEIIIKQWAALKTHFGKSYKDINDDQFAEAVSLIARLPLEGELIIDSPKTKAETYNAELSAKDIHDMVWLLLSAKHMHQLLGELEQPLEAIGSNFHPVVYSHHREYKHIINDSLPILKRLIEPFKESNPIEFERIKSRLKLN